MKKTLKQTPVRRLSRLPYWLCVLPIPFAFGAQAQQAADNETDDNVFDLSPFEINETQESGYMATTTLAGTLVRTDLSDVGSAISVYTAEFLQDIGAYDNETLMAYTVNADVGGAQGTFVNATGSSVDGEENANFGAGFANVRIRGLTRADNTRDYFKVDTPNDGYNSARTEVIRGANSILFGLGSPAGIINTTSESAQFGRNFGELQLRTDEHGTLRSVLDYNHVLMEDELAVRLSLLRNNEKFQQKPAFKLDKRISGTLAWEPSFAKTKNSRLKIEFFGEQGDVKSNTRRGLPPVDAIVNYFKPLEEGGLGGRIWDRTNPEDSALLNLTPVDSNAWGNGNLVLIYRNDSEYSSSTPFMVTEKDYNSVGSYNRAGNGQIFINDPGDPDRLPQISNSDSGQFGSRSNTMFNGQQTWLDTNPIFSQGYRNYVRDFLGLSVDNKANLLTALGYTVPVNDPNTTEDERESYVLSIIPERPEFWDRYDDRSLTDDNYYPFFTQLIDGDSKGEQREWYNARAVVSHSFFNNKLAYNLQFFRQEMEFNRFAALGGDSTLRVDASRLLPNGDLNPNAGKAHLRSSPFGGSRKETSDRQAWRATVYASHDFTDKSDGLMAKILGEHYLTGSVSQQEVDQTRFDFMSNGVGEDYWFENRVMVQSAQRRAVLDENGDQVLAKDPKLVGTIYEDNLYPVYEWPSYDQFHVRARTLNYYYISDSLAGLDPSVGLPINNAGPARPPITGQYPYAYFNGAASTYTGDPALIGSSNNWRKPGNYAGWTTGELTLVGAPTDQASQEYLTRDRTYAREKVDSKSWVWQGKLLKGAIIGTYGWREDEYKVRQYNWNAGTSVATQPDPALARFEFEPGAVIDGVTAADETGTATNWSVVLHGHRLIRKLPFELSFMYSEGENRNPEPGRLSIFGGTLPSPQGQTVDKSVVLATRDNKYVLRMTQYKTSVQNATSTASLSGQGFILEQLLGSSANTAVDRIRNGETRWGAADTGLLDQINDPESTLTQAQKDALQDQYDRQVAAVAQNQSFADAWDAFERKFEQEFPQVVQAWWGGSTMTGAFFLPTGATLTEDTISKGLEVELTANPTKNIRLSFSASKTEAIRDNIPGAEFRELIEFMYEEFLGDAGQLPLSVDEFGESTGGTYDRFLTYYDPYQVQTEKNGSTVDELSKWRYNLTANYSFRDGPLKGFGIGTSFRYESPKTIGYGYKINQFGKTVIDLDNPYKNEAIKTWGFWVRYSRKLSDSIDWSIQANIYNAFESNRVVATSVQPDGSLRRGMIREGQFWAITNTFKF